MINDRPLSVKEALYVNKAMQRIAQLSGSISEETDRNDVTYEDTQCSVELSYSIETLKEPTLEWTEHQIDVMIDFYTLKCNLSEFSDCNIDVFGGIPEGSICPSTEVLVKMINDLDLKFTQCCDSTNAELIRIELESKNRDQDLLDLINSAGSGTSSLLNELDVIETVGGMHEGTTYPVGTTFEELWNEIVGIDDRIENFTFDSFTEVKNSSEEFYISQFSWNIIGVVHNMRLSDNKGVISNEPVLGSSYIPSAPIEYAIAEMEDITWTLTGDNIEPVTITVSGRAPSYSGVNLSTTDDPINITTSHLYSASMGVAGTSIMLVKPEVSITANIHTINSEQGWIAVPEASNQLHYTKWKVEDSVNRGPINSENFILPTQADNPVFNGVSYVIYRWGFRSPLANPLTLYRNV